MALNIRMQPQDVKKLSPKLAVIGVGGAGGNAVNNMISSNLEGVEFVVCNTDAQSLDGSLCPNKIQLGLDVTGGLGAGAKPEIGRAAAEESIEDVMNFIDGANMVFITAGMGGGTGTGAAPVIAKACREQGILTVGVVTKPFHFEGTHRMKQAEAGIEQMQQYVDTLIVIPNQNLFRIANEKTTFAEAFKMADSVLQSGVRGVTDLMVMPGLINLDFADIRSAMMDQGKAMLGTGEATGERRAIEAAEAAINNPLLDDVSMKGAQGVIINITGGYDMTLFEADEACNRIRDEVDPDANIIFGSTFDESLEGMMRVSVIATGIDQQQKAKKPTGFDLNKTGFDRNKPITSSNTPKMPLAGMMPQPPKTAPGYAAPMAAQVVEPKAEPESELFEQQAYAGEKPLQAQDAQNTSMRGTRFNDSFIPPKPVEIERVQADQYQSLPSQLQQHVEQFTAQPYQSVVTARDVNTDPRSGYVLRPPVPGSSSAAEKKTTPSLFERITGLGGFRDQMRSTIDNTVPLNPSVSAAPERAPMPTQGSLAIDAPSRQPEKAEDADLDIPAFLRRQAN